MAGEGTFGRRETGTATTAAVAAAADDRVFAGVAMTVAAVARGFGAPARNDVSSTPVPSDVASCGFVAGEGPPSDNGCVAAGGGLCCIVGEGATGITSAAGVVVDDVAAVVGTTAAPIKTDDGG